MMDYKIALALTAETLADLKKGKNHDIIADRETHDQICTVSTPDGDYKILLWDWEPDMRLRNDYNRLLNSIESVRHALIEITEDGTIFQDIQTEDEYGCDGAFDEILGWKAEITLWNDPEDTIV